MSVHFYIVTVTHNGEQVQVYPPRPKPDELSDPGIDWHEVCQRIGTMVMSNGITSITVNRDGQSYRSVKVTTHNDETER